MQHPAVATTHQRYHIPNLKRALEVFEVLAKIQTVLLFLK